MALTYFKGWGQFPTDRTWLLCTERSFCLGLGSSWHHNFLGPITLAWLSLAFRQGRGLCWCLASGLIGDAFKFGSKPGRAELCILASAEPCPARGSHWRSNCSNTSALVNFFNGTSCRNRKAKFFNSDLVLGCSIRLALLYGCRKCAKYNSGALSCPCSFDCNSHSQIRLPHLDSAASRRCFWSNRDLLLVPNYATAGPPCRSWAAAVKQHCVFLAAIFRWRELRL